MADSKDAKETHIPEPPKFSLDDLPAPPKLDMSDMSPGTSTKIPLKKEKDIPGPIPALKKEPQDIVPSEKTGLPSLKPAEAAKANNLANLPPFEIKSKSTPEPKSALQEPDLLMGIPAPQKKEKKPGFFSNLFSKKKKEEKAELSGLPLPKESGNLSEEKINLMPVNDDQFAPPELKSSLTANTVPGLNVPDFSATPELKKEEVKPADTMPSLDIPVSIPEIKKEEDPDWYKEGEKVLKESSTKAADAKSLDAVLSDKEKTMLDEGEEYIKKTTPLAEVKGVGPVREKKLKRAGIKTAEDLAGHDHKKLARKIKIPETHAREIITNAKKITRIKERLKETKAKETKGISQVIKQLEEEKKDLDIMQKKDKITEDKLIEIEGHKELIDVLQALEKKRKELVDQEEKLAQKEIKLSQNDDTYRRDMEHIENLKRRLDHDVRERTQYLINLEKEYFQKAQALAKKQSEVEVREKALAEKEEYAKQKEAGLRLKANEIEDRSISLETKEKKYEKIMKDLEKQDLALKEKEDDLLKRESEYMKKLDILDNHERTILKNLEEKRKSLESKEKEVSMREGRLHTKERTIDKKSVAVEYAKGIIEEEKGKLVDDEFEQYLHEQLGLLKGSGINIDDINMSKNISVPDFSSKSKTIYQLIDTCRDLVKNSRVTEAKVFYNQVRDKYYGTSFSNPKEKESVHNLVRSLYDEINLADIGSNR